MEPFVKCPKCAKTLHYKPVIAGSRGTCPACGTPVRFEKTRVVRVPAPPADTPRRSAVPWLITGGVVVFIAAMLLFWLDISRPPPSEQVHGQEILDLKSQAENFAVNGQPHLAFDKYAELQKLAAGQAITDPQLKSALLTAANEQDKLFASLASTAPATQPIEKPVAADVATPSASPIATAEPAPVAAFPVSGSNPAVADTTPLPVGPRRPAVRAVTLPPQAGHGVNNSPIVDDTVIARVVDAAALFLASQFEDNHIVNDPQDPSYLDALALYALLHDYKTGGDRRFAPSQPFMKGALDALAKVDINDRWAVKVHSLRICAYALANRPEDRPVMEADTKWLIANCSSGAFGVGYVSLAGINDPSSRTTGWNNYDSQYAVLGLAAAEDAGIDVPQGVWGAVQYHWLTCQVNGVHWSDNPDSKEWNIPITLADLASLLTAQQHVTAANPKVRDAIDRSIAWLQTLDNSKVSFHDYFDAGFGDDCLERVGVASGYKYFGDHDWYRESAADAVAQVDQVDHWGTRNANRETSHALLFLVRGRYPILMNKLLTDELELCPDDIANLARYSSHTMERNLDWQIIPITRNWPDWSDSPIVYISGSRDPNLTDAEEQNLKEFIQNGGMLVTEFASANGGYSSFDQWVTKLGTKLFPGCQWGLVPADHPLWSVGLPIKQHQTIRALTNGARLLIVELPSGISQWWQSRGQAAHTDDFNLGMNLFLYASGRTEMRSRMTTTVIPQAPGDPQATIALTDLCLDDGIYPEPLAWPRFAQWFRLQTDLGVTVTNASLADLQPGASPLAHLTGDSAFTATPQDCAALKSYVEAGGIVLIDACGGHTEFINSVRDDLLKKAFPNAALAPMAENHPLLSASGDGMTRLTLEPRDYAKKEIAPDDRAVLILHSGQGAVIVSPLDITSGLLGNNFWGISGFTPAASLAFAQNFVLWVWDGAREK
jgi:hypothetical protein